LKISDLQNNGGIVESELVKRSGEWNGDTVEFYVRMLSFGDVDKIYNSADLTMSQAAELISKAIRLGDNGDEVLTYEQAYSLAPALATLFAEQVMQVNGVGDEPDPKPSSRNKSSGTKSRSHSAAPSAKPAKG